MFMVLLTLLHFFLLLLFIDLRKHAYCANGDFLHPKFPPLIYFIFLTKPPLIYRKFVFLIMDGFLSPAIIHYKSNFYCSF